MDAKITVLFLAADPFSDGGRARLEEEVHAIGRALRRAGAPDTLELVPHFATRIADVQRVLRRHRPRIVHFAGEGDEPGVLRLGDGRGRPRSADGETLDSLFGTPNGAPRGVVLTSGGMLPVVEALSEFVDFGIGMSGPVEDRSAIVFSAAFYAALAAGQDVRTAFGGAAARLRGDGHASAGTPVLRLREGANPRALVAGIPAPRARDGRGTDAAPARLGSLEALEARLVEMLADESFRPGTAERPVRRARMPARRTQEGCGGVSRGSRTPAAPTPPRRRSR